LYARRDFNGAEDMQRDVVLSREKTLGPNHAETVVAKGTQALTLYARGDFSRAATLQRALLQVQEKLLGADHPDARLTRNNLAASLHASGEVAAARALIRPAGAAESPPALRAVAP
jgi:Flp pilus assembly protein TadD